MPNLRHLAIAGFLLALAPTSSLANGDSSLGLFTSLTGNGLGMSSEGVGLGTRDGASSSGTITINDVPAGATVLNAYLYWSNAADTAGDSTAVFQSASTPARRSASTAAPVGPGAARSGSGPR